MIEFLPFEDGDFEFSVLFQHYEEDFEHEVEVGGYPFARLRYFFFEKDRLPRTYLKLDEAQIERFDMFKKIFTRGDYFYLIAYHYFMNVKEYEFEYKVEGKMRATHKDGELRIISFFEPLYDALKQEKTSSQTLLRHEYILSKNKYSYINKLTEFLLNDFTELNDAIRREKNVFAKYGIIVKEIYLEVFREFYSNFVDYLSNQNFNTLKGLIYPSKKEVQSFKLAQRKNYKNLADVQARKMIIDSIYKNLIDKGFISDSTTIQQIDDLFNNKRRELPKIIWLKDITALSTFYKIMEEDKIIQNAEGKHWKILSDYFLLQKDSEISNDELREKKMSKNVILIQELREVFEMLKKIIA